MQRLAKHAGAIVDFTLTYGFWGGVALLFPYLKMYGEASKPTAVAVFAAGGLLTALLGAGIKLSKTPTREVAIATEKIFANHKLLVTELAKAQEH